VVNPVISYIPCENLGHAFSFPCDHPEVIASVLVSALAAARA